MLAELGRETVPTFTNGAKTVGTTRLQLTDKPFSCLKGVILKAPDSNEGIVYLGSGNVTNDNAATTGGIPLHPGDAIGFPIASPDLIYVVASQAGQIVSYCAF